MDVTGKLQTNGTLQAETFDMKTTPQRLKATNRLRKARTSSEPVRPPICCHMTSSLAIPAVPPKRNRAAVPCRRGAPAHLVILKLHLKRSNRPKRLSSEPIEGSRLGVRPNGEKDTVLVCHFGSGRNSDPKTILQKLSSRCPARRFFLPTLSMHMNSESTGGTDSSSRRFEAVD